MPYRAHRSKDELYILNDVVGGFTINRKGLAGDVAAGGTTTMDLTGIADGSYTLVCSLPGHADSGMKATLTVG